MVDQQATPEGLMKAMRCVRPTMLLCETKEDAYVLGHGDAVKQAAEYLAAIRASHAELVEALTHAVERASVMDPFTSDQARVALYRAKELING